MRIVGLTAALVLCLATVSAEKIARPGFEPIEAELIADLHARLLKVGQTVYARVTVEWHGEGCVLRNGATLEGHVVSVVPSMRPVKGSEVGLVFTGSPSLSRDGYALAPDASQLAVLTREQIVVYSVPGK